VLAFTSLLPGALFTAAAWVAVTFAFKFYVTVVGGANPVLGVLGGAIVSLTWLYLLATTTLLRAELNAVLTDRRRGPGAAAPASGRATERSAVAPVPAAVGAGMLAAALLLGRRRR
jgi:uncharacterized BrkB/YihY/UPF0761 family membrane protein